DPALIPVSHDAFDLVWVGSLFTHLDSGLWPKFMKMFESTLRPGGLLIFTTHGREAYHLMVTGSFDYSISYWGRTRLLYTYERTGFGYIRYPGSDSYYGLSLAHPSRVISLATDSTALRLVHFAEKSWNDFHDVFAWARDPDWPIHSRRTSRLTYVRHALL